MADYNININATDNTSRTMNRIQGGLGGLSAGAGRFRAALGAAGAALVALGAVSAVQDQVNQMDALAKSARLAGSAASNDAFRGFQVLQTAMGEAGIDAATFERAMLQTTSRLQEGLEGGEAFADIVGKLGGNILDANGNLADGATVMQEMINALNAGTISTDEFAKVVGGRAGPLIQAQFASINTTAEDLANTLAGVEENANIIPLDAAETAERFNDTMGRVGMQLQSLLTQAILPLLPHLETFANELLANMPGIVDTVTAAFNTLQPVFNLIGTVLTDLVFPIMQSVFEVLGNIATAITPLIETAIPYLIEAFQGLVAIVEEVVGWFTTMTETLGGIYDSAVALKDGVVGTFSDMGDSVKESAQDMTDSVTGWFDDMYMAVVGGSIVPDMVDGVLQEFFRMNDGMTETSYLATSQVQQDFQDTAQVIQDDFIGSLESAFSDGKIEMNDFRGFFSNTLSTILSEALTQGSSINNALSGMFSGLGGGGGGGLGGIVSGIGSWIGGLFGRANGGPVGMGTPYVVGERGPELFVPNANGNIVSNGDVGGASVTFNINAIDTQTGTQFLLDNKQSIVHMIQQAGHKRGREIF